MISASLFAALLSFSPPAVVAIEPSPSEVPPPQMQPAKAEYQAALDRVRTAMKMANEDPSSGSTQLRDALQLLQGFAPLLATDPEGQELRISAQLTLARSLLATDNAEGAREAMDEAIRTSRGDPLPSKSYGPGLAALHREREGVLEKLGAGAIEIECHTPCRVYINERPTQSRTEGLVPGNYRLWIEATDRSEPLVQRLVRIESDGHVFELEFGKVRIDPQEEPKPEPKLAKPRLLPRWADVLLMTAGVAAIGTGATLLAIHAKCPDLSSARDGLCPQMYVTKTAGIITIAAGSAVFLAGTITLSIDESRVANQRNTQASLVWTFRF